MTDFSITQATAPNATGVAGAYQVANDAIDQALLTMKANVFALARAKRWTNPNASGLVDRSGNPITTQHTGQVYNASDASFGGLPSIDISGCADTPYVVPNRGATPPTSFTFIAAVDVTVNKTGGKTHCMISQTGAGGVGFDSYCNSPANGGGAVQNGFGGETHANSGWVAANSTPCIQVVSYDASTKMARAGINGLPGNAVTFTTGPAPGSTDFFRVFGYVSDNGYNLLGKWETWAILNVAAGAGGAIDALLAAAITSMRSVYGF